MAGHRSPQSTQSYAKISPTKLAKSYNAAGYFERNLRTIEALVDQQAARKWAYGQRALEVLRSWQPLMISLTSALIGWRA
jgi:hypothetical protein